MLPLIAHHSSDDFPISSLCGKRCEKNRSTQRTSLGRCGFARQDKDRKIAKNPHDRQKAHEIMFRKSQTTLETHIDDDKEHRKYVPAMTNRTEKHTGDNKTCRKGALAMETPKTVLAMTKTPNRCVFHGKSNGQTRRTACLPVVSLIVCRFQPLCFLPGITGRSREDSDRR